MFRGRHDHTIDQKGRLSIPAGFRTELQRQSERAPMLTISKDHLELYPRDDYEAMERDLAAKPDLQPEVQAYRRLFIGQATECPIDSQGRILVAATPRTRSIEEQGHRGRKSQEDRDLADRPLRQGNEIDSREARGDPTFSG